MWHPYYSYWNRITVVYRINSIKYELFLTYKQLCIVTSGLCVMTNHNILFIRIF